MQLLFYLKFSISRSVFDITLRELKKLASLHVGRWWRVGDAWRIKDAHIIACECGRVTESGRCSYHCMWAGDLKDFAVWCESSSSSSSLTFYFGLYHHYKNWLLSSSLYDLTIKRNFFHSRSEFISSDHYSPLQIEKVQFEFIDRLLDLRIEFNLHKLSIANKPGQGAQVGGVNMVEPTAFIIQWIQNSDMA